MEERGHINPIGEVVVDGDDVHVAVVGDIDGASAPTLQRRLHDIVETTSGTVVLDMSGVSFIDSIGIRVALELDQHLKARGRSLILRDVSAPARRLLELAGLCQTLRIDGSS